MHKAKTITAPLALLEEAAEAFATLGMFESLERAKAVLGNPDSEQDAQGYWRRNQQAILDVGRFEGAKGVVYQVMRDAVTLSVTLDARQLGAYGSLYDGPLVRRAYTYKHQPGNDAAHRIGVAAQSTGIGGDAIDKGLKLLCELERAGLGVFEL